MSPIKICTQCTSNNGPDDLYCSECGTPLQRLAPANRDTPPPGDLSTSRRSLELRRWQHLSRRAAVALLVIGALAAAVLLTKYTALVSYVTQRRGFSSSLPTMPRLGVQPSAPAADVVRDCGEVLALGAERLAFKTDCADENRSESECFASQAGLDTASGLYAGCQRRINDDLSTHLSNTSRSKIEHLRSQLIAWINYYAGITAGNGTASTHIPAQAEAPIEDAIHRVIESLKKDDGTRTQMTAQAHRTMSALVDFLEETQKNAASSEAESDSLEVAAQLSKITDSLGSAITSLPPDAQAIVTAFLDKYVSPNDPPKDIRANARRELQARVGTVVDTNDIPPFANERLHHFSDLVNPQIRNISAYLDLAQGALVIEFDDPDPIWCNIPCFRPVPLLIRIFDKYGQVVTFFTTQERFAPATVVAFWQYDLRYYPASERPFIAMLPTGNRIAYQLTAAVVEQATSVEVGFDSTTVYPNTVICKPPAPSWRPGDSSPCN